MSQEWPLPIADVDVSTAITDEIPKALKSLRSVHSGATEPSSTVAYMMWVDTTAGWLKMRNSTDTGWVLIAPLVGDDVLLEIPIEDVTATVNLPAFLARHDFDVATIEIVMDTATDGSDGSNHYSFDLINKTQASASLFVTNPTTNGNEATAYAAYTLTPDQNLAVNAGDVLEFTVTKVGTGPSITDWSAAKGRVQIRGTLR